MTMALPWRYAASLIIAARGEANKTTLLMIRRSSKNRHLPDVEVFPGGVVEEADFSGSWLPVLTSVQSVAPLLLSSDRPATFLEHTTAADTDSADRLPAELGFRLAALRETFEETGLLLVRRPDGGSGSELLEPAVASAWRRRVQREPAALLQLARQLGVAPDVWQLREWSCWLTPTVLVRRHDTAFFIACLPQQPSHLTPDHTETARVEWSCADEVLQEHTAGRLQLMPPQIYELGRLRLFPFWSQLDHFSRQRADRGLQRLCPVVHALSDGRFIGTLEGDDFHPPEPDVLSSGTDPLTLPLSFEQVTAQTTNFHRSIDMKRVQCTITLPYGHVSPELSEQLSRL